MMQIKNIVFDFGGVLMDWDPRYMYRKVFESEEEMEYFMQHICHSKWNAQFDKGLPFQEGVNERIEKFPEYKEQIQMYKDRWIEMVGGDIPKNSKLVYELKPSYRLFGLTNWAEDTFQLVYNQYPFFKELEGIVVSGTEKIIKPDPAIFNILLKRYQIQSSESLFIDDNYDNILVARELGFETIWVEPSTNLREELISAGIAL
jgi:2-haloacid dehalogenase